MLLFVDVRLRDVSAGQRPDDAVAFAIYSVPHLISTFRYMHLYRYSDMHTIREVLVISRFFDYLLGIRDNSHH